MKNHSYESEKRLARFLTLPQVSDLTALGKSTILAWEKKGLFPLAVRLTRGKRVWFEGSVRGWIFEQTNKES